MKKVVSKLLAVCMGTVLSVSLVACGETPPEHQHSFSEEWTKDGVSHWHACDGDECTVKEGEAEHTVEEGVCTVCGYEAIEAHTCTFETEWSSNATYHWYACEDETCSEKSQKERHDFDGNECEVCGYEKPATPPSNWASYFVFDNVTAQKTASTYYAEYDMTLTESESIKVAEEEWLWETTDYYYNETTYQTFAVYFDGTNAYANGAIDGEMEMQKMLFFFDIDFSSNASSFTQTSEGVFQAAQIQIYSLTYTNVRIEVENGKIISISYSQTLSSGGVTFTTTAAYTFADWGTTQIDGSGYTQPSAWSTYFSFDNATVARTHYATVNGVRKDFASDAVWKVDGNEWSSVYDKTESEEIVLSTDYYYYDGTNAYLNGEAVDYSEIESWSLSVGIGFLEGYEGAFDRSTAGDTTVYTADTIVYFEAITYTDLTIVVEDGKILSIEYTQQGGYMDADEMRHPLTYHFSFTDYGTTVVTDPYPTV